MKRDLLFSDAEADKKPLYAVRFKYAKKRGGTNSRDVKIAEFIPLLSPEIKTEPKREIPEIRAKVSLAEFVRYSKSLGCKENRSGGRIFLTTEDGETYSRLIVYAVVRQTIFSSEKVARLQEIVADLPLFDVRYWASLFVNYFKEFRNRRYLWRPAKAFKLVYGID